MQRIFEKLHPGYAQGFDVVEMLVDRHSEFQHIRLFRAPLHGLVLMLDDIVQFTEIDEFIYSEMMCHPALFAHGDPRRVLIIGGGDGLVLREVLKHPSIEEVVLCEIDPAMIALARSELAALNAGVMTDPRLQVVAEDAAKFVAAAENRGRFDLISGDRPDPVGPGRSLFAEKFYRDCRAALSPRGVLVLQSGVPLYQRDEFRNDAMQLARIFPHSGFLFAAVATYVGGAMALGWGAAFPFGPSGGRAMKPDADEIAARFARAAIATRYYTPAIHAASFAAPRYLADILREVERERTT